MYEVVLEDGLIFHIDDYVLRHSTSRCDPYGILHWIETSISCEWKSITKVD